MSSAVKQRPGRPLGVTIAVIASLFMFSFVPLVRVGAILLVERHFRTMDNMLVLPDGQVVEGFSGGNFRGDVTDAQVYLQIGFALAFIVVAFFAWRGRPTFMRYIFIIAVLLLTVTTMALTVVPTLFGGASGAGASGGSLDAFFNTVVCAQFVVSLLVPLYVVWYLNRAPARAFYRGYYLAEESAATQ